MSAWNWGISIITFAFGLGIGFLAAYLLIPRSGRIQELEKDLETAQTAHREYRDKVNQHFQKTAELFEDMTDRYRAVYRHMAGSAQVLCEQQPPALQVDPAARSARLTELDAADTTVADAAPAQPRRDRETSARDLDDDQAYGDAPHIPELTDEIPAGAGERAKPASSTPQ
ncbi:MAG: YhcB family protein [Gammaproteobacteria bacterium]